MTYNLSPARALRESWSDLEKMLKSRRFTVFLDFDGTLTPVHSRPELAELSEVMRGKLARLVSRVRVVIVSGRDRNDVAELVGLEDLIYAGCHGFDIEAPGLPPIPTFEGAATSAEISELGSVIKSAVDSVVGVIVKVKQWAVAVHYRSVADGESEELENKVMSLVGGFPKFRARSGRKVIEIIPNVDWHKGMAVLWLSKIFDELDGGSSIPIYVGDDITDEDAFRSLAGRGITVFVNSNRDLTAADYCVDDSDEVGRLLDKLFHIAAIT